MNSVNLKYQKSLIFLAAILLVGCTTSSKKEVATTNKATTNKATTNKVTIDNVPLSMEAPQGGPPGMVWVPGGKFTMGALDHDEEAREDERRRYSG